MKSFINGFSHTRCTLLVAHIVFNLFLDASSEEFLETLTQQSLASPDTSLHKNLLCSKLLSALALHQVYQARFAGCHKSIFLLEAEDSIIK